MSARSTSSAFRATGRPGTRRPLPRGVLTRLETSRVVVYSLVAGVIVGVLGSALRYLLDAAAGLLATFVQFRPPGTPGEGGLLHAFGQAGPALLVGIPLLLVLAALVRPHGRDPLEEAVRAYHATEPPAPPAAQARTLGAAVLSYLSLAGVGRDGPFTAVGSVSARVLLRVARLGVHEGRTLTLACVGAALGMVLHAPLAAAVLVVELLYRRFEFEVEVLLPAVLASVTAYAVYGAMFGFGPLLTPSVLQAPLALQLPLYAALGLAVALAAWLVAQVRALLPTPRESVWARVGVALGFGALVSGVALVSPQILGDGTGWLQLALSGFQDQESLTQGLLRLGVLLGVAWLGFGGTILATISAGGLLGVGVAGLLPGLGLDPVVAGLVGAAAFLTTTHNTPVAATLLIAAWGGDALLPALLAGTLLAHALSGEATLLGSQRRARADSPVHAAAMVVPTAPAAADVTDDAAGPVTLPLTADESEERLYRVPLPSAWQDVPVESVVWPHDVQYVAVVRDGEVHLSRPGQMFRAGDELVLLATEEQFGAFQDALSTPGESGGGAAP